jgi:hypothetical protein
MAANVREVDDPAEIERINLLAQVRYPKSAIFAPRAAACAVLRADPMVISLVDESEGFAQPVLLKVRARTELEMAD